MTATISILPNFISNHKLRDELDNRQRGIVTTGNRYQPTKPDESMASMEVATVKKAAAKKLGRGAEAYTGASSISTGGERPITAVNNDSKSDANAKEAKSDTAVTGRTVSVKKPSLAKLTDDIEQQAFCSYFLSSKGCNMGDNCPYSHNMPAEQQEARVAKQSLDVFNLTWGADFRDNYVIHFPPATTSVAKTPNSKFTAKEAKKTG